MFLPGFRSDMEGTKAKALEKFCNQKPSSLEMSEKLEQLRWLENGGKIKVGITKQLSYPVDTIEDLNEVRKIYEKKHHIYYWDFTYFKFKFFFL